MMQRIVLFKLKDEYRNDAARAEFAQRTRNDLSALSQVRGVTVGVAAEDETESNWDIAITVQFDSLEDVEAYIPDPAHRAYVDDYAMPKVAFRKAWNFKL